MTPEKETMLRLYRELGTITSACEGTGITRQTHYNWLDNDAEYKAAIKSMDEDCAILLEDAAKKRALDGSDTLLIFLLKAARPEKYRERTEIKHDFTTVSDAELIAQAESIIAGAGEEKA